MTRKTPHQPSVTTLTGSTDVECRIDADVAREIVAASGMEVSPSAQRPTGVVIRWRRASLIMRGWCPRAIAPARTPWWARLSMAAARLLDRIADHQDAARSRRELLGLDDRALRDLGIDRSTACHLSNVPYWYRRDRPS